MTTDFAKVSFSHVHFYADRIKELSEYKKLEAKLNAFADKIGVDGYDVKEGRATWLSLSGQHGDPVTGKVEPENFKVHGQDVVEQLLVGLGWRITGVCNATETTTLALTSPDSEGCKILVTAHNKSSMDELGSEQASKKAKTSAEPLSHFAAAELARFAGSQSGRQGMAVLGFVTQPGGVEKIHKKYTDLHPKLVTCEPKVYGTVKVFEVYAYYKGDVKVSEADTGTLLRFVEGASADLCVMPGVNKVEATFTARAMSAYCDHWVSNVVSRTGFCDTLKDTLGFSPKVDFNAGVVAAGEAQIESTVTGNDPDTVLLDDTVALKDQSQVYLPTNNALSEVGHVYFYVKEIGQGIQHIASRVKDLPTMVQRANDYRKMTGAGLDFLNIPPSYYGALNADALSKDAGIELSVAEKCIAALHAAKIVDSNDIVAIDATRAAVAKALPAGVDSKIADIVLRGRYRNIYNLLRDHLSEETYVKVVRNKVLVDVQGEDLLMQIFSATVLQRNAGEEAPFIEFIQRVCSEKKDASGKPKPIRPGCGGFGIRNFLTLFLSIEVSKATKGRADAQAAGKTALADHYKKVVAAFTSQLEESNPVLTSMSDAMTLEGLALESGDTAGAAKFASQKTKACDDLQLISTKYKGIMKELRENEPKA